jgi:hypothetical protein
VSCSVHDAVRLEARGIPTALVGTEPFLDEALEQSRLLGLPNYPVALVAHPVQLLRQSELEALADEAFPRIEKLLTRSGDHPAE